jgi:hypothetical protein
MHVPSGLVPTAGRPVVVIVAHVYEVQCWRNVAGPILELKVGRSRRHREINRLFHSIRTARTWVQQQNQQQHLHNTHTMCRYAPAVFIVSARDLLCTDRSCSV